MVRSSKESGIPAAVSKALKAEAARIGGSNGSLTKKIGEALEGAYLRGAAAKGAQAGLKWKQVPAKSRELLWMLVQADLDALEEGDRAGLEWHRHRDGHLRGQHNWVRVHIKVDVSGDTMELGGDSGWPETATAPLEQFGLIERYTLIRYGHQESEYRLCPTWDALVLYGAYTAEMGNPREAARVKAVRGDWQKRARKEERSRNREPFADEDEEDSGPMETERFH